MTAELEAATTEFIGYLSDRNSADIYQFLHPSVIGSLSRVFEAYRKRNKSGLTDEEVFAELYEEYCYGDFEDRDFDVIGEVREGSDMAHVIIRSSGASYPIESSWVETLCFSKYEGNWRPLLPTYFIANVGTEYEKEIEQDAALKGQRDAAVESEFG